MIPLEQCKHGVLYQLRSRNLTVGVYHAMDRSFTGIRTKFAARFLDREFHWDTGAPHGTAKPVLELEACPIENLETSLGTVCSVCREPCEYVHFPDGSRSVTIAGVDMVVPGEWVHTTSAGEHRVLATGVSNTALFEWLDERLEKMGLKSSAGDEEG